MHLWILRHGDALRPTGTSDAERALSPLGRQQARRIGTFLARQTPLPDTVMTSPFRRAVQTATTVAGQCAHLPVESTDALISGASLEGLYHFLASRKERSLLLVGHEPLMSTFASSLSAGHAGSFMHFSPCTLGLIQYTGRARPNGGTLDLLISPASIMRAKGTSSEKRP